MKLLTWNLGGIGTAESIPDMRVRHEKIVEEILEKDYSILCFQEVWKDEIRQLLSESLVSGTLIDSSNVALINT